MKALTHITSLTRRSALCSAAALFVTAVLLSACRETNPYTARRDTIRLGAGDAMAYNRAVQTIDPWPVYSKNANIPADGKRMMVGIKRYNRNESLEPQSTNTSDRFADTAGPGAAPPIAPPPAAPAP